jgi:lipopolysaccharide/colanic/teichoic acid biosynthesis glycosyltransferase
VAGSLFKAVEYYLGYGKIPGLPVVHLCSDRPTKANLLLKRKIESFFALSVLALFSPVFVFIGLLVFLSSKGNVFFKQEAIGKNGRPFYMYKFRTMVHGDHQRRHKEWTQHLVHNGDIPYKKMADDDRITPIGHFLRKYSLDELPQLFNILKGEMSLIAPRPPLTYEYGDYEEWHKQRLAISPGITGLHQVTARDSSTFNEMITLDLFYIYNYSLLLDLYIALKTIPTMLLGKGGG